MACGSAARRRRAARYVVQVRPDGATVVVGPREVLFVTRLTGQPRWCGPAPRGPVRLGAEIPRAHHERLGLVGTPGAVGNTMTPRSGSRGAGLAIGPGTSPGRVATSSDVPPTCQADPVGRGAACRPSIPGRPPADGAGASSTDPADAARTAALPPRTSMVARGLATAAGGAGRVQVCGPWSPAASVWLTRGERPSPTWERAGTSPVAVRGGGRASPGLRSLAPGAGGWQTRRTVAARGPGRLAAHGLGLRPSRPWTPRRSALGLREVVAAAGATPTVLHCCAGDRPSRDPARCQATGISLDTSGLRGPHLGGGGGRRRVRDDAVCRCRAVPRLPPAADLARRSSDAGPTSGWTRRPWWWSLPVLWAQPRLPVAEAVSAERTAVEVVRSVRRYSATTWIQRQTRTGIA